MTETRSVPEDRIKTLAVRIALRGVPISAPDDEILQQASREMGLALAEKLFEFNKVSRAPGPGKGEVIFSVSLDIIVPETAPEETE